jgi:hypothetical protein
MGKLLIIFEAIKALGVIFTKLDKWIVEPFKKWNKKRKDKKIDKHYQNKIDRIDTIKTEINNERLKPATKESDKRLEELLRKLHNLGAEYDNND